MVHKSHVIEAKLQQIILVNYFFNQAIHVDFHGYRLLHESLDLDLQL
jgi:hypothetical protein